MNEKKKKNTFVKDVAAPTIIEAADRLDEWGRSIYDMYVISYGDYEERPGYIQLRIYGWENDQTRETYNV